MRLGKVMVVEDSPTMRTIVGNMLRSLDCEQVIECADGAEAWRRIAEEGERVDLLLTDYNMPELSGVELIRKVRRHHGAEEVPIIMFTVRKRKEDVIEAVRAGANGYIAKPFSRAQLQQQIERVVQRTTETRMRRWAEGIVAGSRKLHLQHEAPFVLFAERADDVEGLLRLHSEAHLRYLDRARRAIERLNAEYPELKLEYVLSADTREIVRYIRLFRQRLRLVLIDAGVGGRGVTLARLSSISRGEATSIALVCDRVDQLPLADRTGLEQLGVLLFEHRRLDGEVIDHLFNDMVAARSVKKEIGEISPELIARRLRRDIQLLTSLPVLPEVHYRIMRLSRDPESPLRAWAEAVASDPASSALVMRRVRSPIYGFQGRVDDIEAAVTLLGKKAVRELIVSEALRRSLVSVDDGDFDAEAYWRHSMATGLAAHILSLRLERAAWSREEQQTFEKLQLSDALVQALERFRLWELFPLQDGEDPFAGGIMHDIGKVVLAHCYPGLFSLVVTEMEFQQWRQPMHQVERRIGGVDHLQAGSILAEHWHFPAPFQHVVSHHQAPAADDYYCQLVQLADVLAAGTCPFPSAQRSPLWEAMQGRVEEGGLVPDVDVEDEKGRERVARFAALPERLYERMDLADLMELGMLMRRDLQRLVEEVHICMN